VREVYRIKARPADAFVCCGGRDRNVGKSADARPLLRCTPYTLRTSSPWHGIGRWTRGPPAS
jgi:hypothetical protein